MEDQVNADTGTALEISGPIGLRAKLSGIKGLDTPSILIAILIAVCTIIFVYTWWQGQQNDDKARQLFATQHANTQALLKTVIETQKTTIELIKSAQQTSDETISEMTWVLTRTQEQRNSLRLEMPASLRKKLNAAR